MTFNGWTFLFEVINFLALAFILQRLLYRPLHDAIDRRRQAIESAQAEAARAREEAEEERQQLAARLDSMERERERVLHETREEAETERDRILADAAKEAERRETLAREALARERAEALRQLQHVVVEEAGRLAERMIGDVSDVGLDGRLAGRLAGVLRSLPEKERELVRRGSSADETATLESAHAVAPGAVSEVQDALADVLDRDVHMRVETKPELVAGVRLRLDGHVWDASLAGQVTGTDAEQAGNETP